MKNLFINLHCTISILAETKEEFFLTPTEMYTLFIYFSCFINLQIDIRGSESYRGK